MVRRGKVGKYGFVLVIVFSVYLILLSIIGESEHVSNLFYYGFWLVTGCVIGFFWSSYLNNKS